MRRHNQYNGKLKNGVFHNMANKIYTFINDITGVYARRKAVTFSLLSQPDQQM